MTRTTFMLAAMAPFVFASPRYRTLAAPLQAEAVAATAAQLTTLRSCYLDGPGPEALLLGYGCLTPAQIVTGARNLATVMQQLSV